MTTEKPIPFSAPMIRAIIREHTHTGSGKTRTMRQHGLKGLPKDAFFIGMTHPEPGSFIYAIIDRNDEAFVIFRPQGENKRLMKKLARKVAKELSILHYQLHEKDE